MSGAPQAMSKFVPDKGSYFYATSTDVRERVVGGDLMVAPRVVRDVDRSWSGSVFLCAGRDQTAVVGVRQNEPLFKDQKIMFRRDLYAFEPVGPEILDALGLIGSKV